MSNQTIQLWDVTTTAGPDHPVSINTWRARITLNYLGIPSKTNWVHLGDIKDTAKSLGVTPVEKTPLGEDLYACPFIYDPATEKYVMDSYDVARYLTETYGGPKSSNAATLFPWSREDDQKFIAEHSAKAIGGALVPLLIIKVSQLFSPEGGAYLRASRKEWFGATLEQIQVPDEKRAEKWEALHAYLDEPGVSARAEAVKEGVTFRDIVIAASFKWIQLAAQPGEFEALLAWKDGKWGRFFAEFEKYLEVRN